ncbi:protein kinase domain protein [Penicillium cataractarum]|uniref:Protein kinase domain protein n=1 Tax=Penicillium cataractarum TaxID=2100454 RepID=A0A9W9VWE1_9EURO|nr:protein kinase domain protein [Penicillium cataractarum]KAJ5390627.1 protein kinase domain protein [Penicillium cataractarum]
MGILGPTPLDIFQRGKRSQGLFTEDERLAKTCENNLEGSCKQYIIIPAGVSLGRGNSSSKEEIRG